MSVRVLSAVFDGSRHGGTDLLMLLALADFSDDQGNSYPAVPTLAAKCRMSPRNAGYILKNLQSTGELEIRPNEGPRGTNRYRIVLEALVPLKPAAGVKQAGGVQPAAGVGMKRTAGVQPAAGVQPTSEAPAVGCTAPLQPIADEPSLNRQEPSSKARRVRSEASADVALPDWIPRETWADFVAMRKAMRKAMTPAAMRLQVKTLGDLRAQGHDPKAVLEQSIAASWQGLFPVKGAPHSGAVLSSDERFGGAH